MVDSNSEMANYIYRIIFANPYIPFSWGFNSQRAIENGLQFKVQGFKFKGFVQVVYNECTDLFDVKFLEDTFVKELVTSEEGLYLDNLVSVIDNVVEKTDNYDNDCKEWLENI